MTLVLIYKKEKKRFAFAERKTSTLHTTAVLHKKLSLDCVIQSQSIISPLQLIINDSDLTYDKYVVTTQEIQK